MVIDYLLDDAEHKTYEQAKAGIDETLKKMGLDYLDMMIIHFPQPWVEVNQSENRYVEGNSAAWKALEDAYQEGKLKAIGVSNFQIGDLESLMETAEEMLKFLQLKPQMQLLSIRSSDIAFTMSAKGPLWERAKHFDGEIPLF